MTGYYYDKFIADII